MDTFRLWLCHLVRNCWHAHRSGCLSRLTSPRSYGRTDRFTRAFFVRFSNEQLIDFVACNRCGHRPRLQKVDSVASSSSWTFVDIVARRSDAVSVRVTSMFTEQRLCCDFVQLVCVSEIAVFRSDVPHHCRFEPLLKLAVVGSGFPLHIGDPGSRLEELCGC